MWWAERYPRSISSSRQALVGADPHDALQLPQFRQDRFLGEARPVELHDAPRIEQVEVEEVKIGIEALK